MPSPIFALGASFVVGPLLCVGLFLEGWARLFVLVVLRLLQDGVVVVGIGLHEFKFHP